MIILTIILAIFGICLIVFSAIAFCFRDLPGGRQESIFFVSIFILGLLFLGGAFLSNSSRTNDLGYEQGYKQGQIDAAQGIQKYYLTTRPKVWKKKE